MTTISPEAIAAAWGTWKSRHGGKLGPGPAFTEAIEAAVAVVINENGAALSGMAEPVAWTSRAELDLLQEHWPLVGVLNASSVETLTHDVSLFAAPSVSDLGEENERLKKAATGLSRVLLPIHMQLAERDLIEDPVADDVTLFSFMGSGASDRVTVGEYRKAMAALDVALGGLQKEGK